MALGIVPGSRVPVSSSMALSGPKDRPFANWHETGEVTRMMCMAHVPHEPGDEVDRIVELEQEVDQLKDAVASHAVVDQAIGMIVALRRVAPDQGWAVLQHVSQHTNIKLRNVAEFILIWARNGVMPTEIRVELEEALERYAPTRIPGSDQD